MIDSLIDEKIYDRGLFESVKGVQITLYNSTSYVENFFTFKNFNSLHRISLISSDINFGNFFTMSIFRNFSQESNITSGISQNRQFTILSHKKPRLFR
jgi:hypothetical protein